MTGQLVRGVAALMVSVSTALAVAGCERLAGRASAAPIASGAFIDDFLGPAGSPPNPKYWYTDVGPSSVHGWERGSLQTYTDSPENIRLDGHGNLVIEARRSGDSYTSGRIVTRGKLLFPFGTVTARIKLPEGQGIWPAFWMLGANITSVGWPESGEIDIIELINGETFNMSLHGPGADLVTSGSYEDLGSGYHNYWMTRRENSITIGVNEKAYVTYTPNSLPEGSRWVFDKLMFVLLNVAVGGDWPGPPDRSTPFPARMSVDWVSFEPLGSRNGSAQDGVVGRPKGRG